MSCPKCHDSKIIPLFRGRLTCAVTLCDQCVNGVCSEKYKKQVLKIFENLEHEEKRKFLDKKAKVERKARQAF